MVTLNDHYKLDLKADSHCTNRCRQTATDTLVWFCLISVLPLLASVAIGQFPTLQLEGAEFILAERLLEWAQLNLRSLRAAHLPGRLNQGADMLSRSNVPSEEWMLHPQVVQKIWKTFGKAEVDLFASKDNSHCTTYYSKDRDALAHDWPNLLLYAFPPIALLPQVIRRIREQGHKRCYWWSPCGGTNLGCQS